MTKIHPNVIVPSIDISELQSDCRDRKEEAAVMTVWRKSLLFNCSGFTVFDAKGNLVYRVDNYGSENRGEVVLMDASGKPLLTIRRKKLSLGDQWLVFNGEKTVKPLYAVKRHMHLRSSHSVAHVAPFAGVDGDGFDVEGSYSRRCCTVYDAQRRAVAEVRQKEAVGADVFRLVVQPEIETSLAMAVVVALDQMFGPRHSLLSCWSS